MGIDPITAGIGAVGSIVGGLFGSNNNNKSTTTNEPWKAQQPYLKAGMADAALQYNKQRGTPYFTGDLYANLDPRSIAGIEGLYGYAGNQGATNAAQVSGVSPALLAQHGNLISGTNRLLGFNPADPTEANIASARRYADNPAMDGIIDAASRDVTRNLTEEALPQLNRMASATGNINSNKTAIKEGILQRGAADRIADISAGLRGDAYASGLDLAERARTTNQSDYLNSLVQGGSLADRSLARGLDATNQGQGLAYDNFDAMMKAGGLYQQDAQGDLTSAFDKWKGTDERAFDLLNRYNAIIAGGNWGGTTTTTQPGGGLQGILQGALGGGSSALGLYGGFRNILNSGAPSATYNMGSAPFGGLY